MSPENEKLQFFMGTIRDKSQRLKKRSVASLEEYKANYDLQKIVERELQEAIQGCIDTGLRIVSSHGLRHSDDNVGIFDSLSEGGVVPADFATQMRDLVRFRNILIHEYFRIDPEKVYGHLQEDPRILDQFLKHVLAFLSGRK